MAWTLHNRVTRNLNDVQVEQHADSNVTDAIRRAQDYAQSFLRAAGFTQDQMAVWDTDGSGGQKKCPAQLQDIIGDIAAAYILRDFYGQNLSTTGDNRTKATDLYRSATEQLRDIAGGKTMLVDVEKQNAPVPGSQFFRSDSTQARKFTVGNDNETGTLDNL